MKKMILILIAFILVSWVLFFGVQVLVGKSLGHEIDLVEKGIMATIFSLIMPLGTWMSVYSAFPRIKYLENNDTEKPAFKVACSSVIEVPKEFDFGRLKIEISNKWLITFSDDIGRVLKFRTRWHFFKNWGAAAWMKYDDNTGKLYFEYFPMVAMQDDLARKMRKEIESSLTI